MSFSILPWGTETSGARRAERTRGVPVSTRAFFEPSRRALGVRGAGALWRAEQPNWFGFPGALQPTRLIVADSIPSHGQPAYIPPSRRVGDVGRPAGGFLGANEVSSAIFVPREDFSRHVELREAACHEAGHAHVAQRYGSKLEELYVRPDASGMTTYRRPRSMTLAQRAHIIFAGAAAAHRFYAPDRRAGRMSNKLADYLGEKDREIVESLAKEACPDFVGQADWFWRRLHETQQIVESEWAPIRRLAKAIIDRQGVYLFETAKPVEVPQETQQAAQRGRLFEKAMEVLYGPGGIYP